MKISDVEVTENTLLDTIIHSGTLNHIFFSEGAREAKWSSGMILASGSYSEIARGPGFNSRLGPVILYSPGDYLSHFRL